MAGVYIHIPFCRQACHYCNFHFSTNLANQSSMVDAICSEIRNTTIDPSDNNLESIYFGGGTPSLLTIPEIEQIFTALHSIYQWDDSAEITIETNPEDIQEDYLKGLQDHGVNRISIGIQSFLASDLSSMNRAHNEKQSYEALEMIVAANFRSYTLDLMFGLIGRSSEEWAKNIKIALQYNPPHFSCYNLTIEEQTAYAHWKAQGKIKESGDQDQQAQYLLTEEILCQNEYAHYEISNYSKEGHQAIHNTNYWKGKIYRGYGPGAHSYDGKTRSWNVSNNSKYITGLSNGNPIASTEVLTNNDMYNETIMLGLRTQWGINSSDLCRNNSILKTHWQLSAKSLLDENILIQEGDNFKLNKSWWYLSDDIASQLFIID